MGSRSTYVWLLLRLLAIALCVATAAGFGGRGGWVLDLLSEFRFQYLILLGLLCLIFMVGRKGGMMLIAAAFALANLWPVASLHLPNGSVGAASTGVRLLFVVSDPEGRATDSTAAFVRSRNIDLVAIAGADAAGLERLRRLLPEHRYLQSQTREDAYGVAIVSRFPILAGRSATLGSSKSPVAIARCRVPAGEATFVVARMLEGWGSANWSERNSQLADLGTLVAGEKGEVVLIGALETTPWSPFFADLLARSHLADGRKGNGVIATWPRWLGAAGIPLDHLLHSPGVAVEEMRSVPAPWSEHRPIVASVRLRK